MSRTRAHMPYRARAHRDRRPQAIHDHRHGDCDLPERKKWLRELKRVQHPHILWWKYRCIWDLSRQEWENICGCHLCSGRYEHEKQKRSRREEGRRLIGEQRTENEVENEAWPPAPEGTDGQQPEGA